MKEIKREVYTITSTNITSEVDDIVIENIESAKLYDGSGDFYATYITKDNKKKKGALDLHEDDEKVVIDLLSKVKGGVVTTRKRNLFEATKIWLYFLGACAIVLGVLYWLSVDGGSVRVPAIVIPILEFIMDFGIFKTGAIVLAVTALGCGFSIINRKTITEFRKN